MDTKLHKHSEYPHIYHGNGERGRLDICLNCDTTGEKYWGFTDLDARINAFVEQRKDCAKTEVVEK